MDIEKALNHLILKLHHLMIITGSNKAKDAYQYSINELKYIINEYKNN